MLGKVCVLLTDTMKYNLANLPLQSVCKTVCASSCIDTIVCLCQVTKVHIVPMEVIACRTPTGVQCTPSICFIGVCCAE